MPIPSTRQELVKLIVESYTKLQNELESISSDAAGLPCVDDWTIKDLLAVRLWWTERVVAWIEMGLRGESPILPAEGYSWKETPRLNGEIVEKGKEQTYHEVCERLNKGVEKVLKTIESLNDRELLHVGVFDWAGKWPIARWISINTARQYKTARTYIRRSMKN